MVAGSKFRFVAELSVALIAVMLLIASIVSPDWVETLTGASPDNGDGGVEWGAALVAGGGVVGVSWVGPGRGRGRCSSA